jgi:hypothetical protein
MHRSGTSAITRVLNLLGAEIGRDIYPANPNNPTGFWENNRILELHQRLLREIGYFWDDVRPLPEKWWHTAEAKRIHQQIITVLQDDFKKAELWVVKDPRISRLLKLWHGILAEVSCRPYFIIMFRHPLEVAASLKKRDNLPIEKCLLLWLEHLMDAEQETRNYPRVFVSFHEFMLDWKETMEKVSRVLQIEWPVDYSDVQSSVDDFLDPDLKHHDASKEDSWTESNLPEDVRLAYDELVGEQNKPTNTISETFAHLSQKMNADLQNFPASALLGEVQVRSRDINKVRNILDEKSHQLHNHKSELSLCKSQLSRSTSRLVRCESQLSERNARIDKMMNTWSWKLTKPLRDLASLVKRLEDKKQ